MCIILPKVVFTMNTKTKRFLVHIKRWFIELIQIVCGTAVMAAGTAFFLLPNKLSAGGFSGISTLFYYLFNLPLGTTMFLLNVPLFIFSFFKNGKQFYNRNIFSFIFHRCFRKNRTCNTWQNTIMHLWTEYL